MVSKGWMLSEAIGTGPPRKPPGATVGYGDSEDWEDRIRRTPYMSVKELQSFLAELEEEFGLTRK